MSAAEPPVPSTPGAAAPVPAARPPAKAENLPVNLVCNILVPTVVLTWLSGARTLGPHLGLAVALAFPLGYGLYDFAVRRRWNFISVIGFASVLISGGFGLLNLAGFWFAVKDAAIPTAIGLAVLASMRAKTPLLNELLYNPQVIDVAKVDAALAARNAQAGFAALMRRATGLLSLAFFASAVLNYSLARYLLRSPPGTEAFDHDLAKMHLLSWPVIVLPSMAMMMFAFWRLLGGITRLTGLTLDDIFHSPPKK
jgi:hypothetical protein